MKMYITALVLSVNYLCVLTEYKNRNQNHRFSKNIREPDHLLETVFFNRILLVKKYVSNKQKVNVPLRFIKLLCRYFYNKKKILISHM